MTDVIIVGGGLAGLNTARFILENSDYKVILVDKRAPSKNNPLRLTFTDIVRKYDLYDCIQAEYSAFGVLSYHNARALHRFPEKRFVALDYKKSCEKYLSNIINHSNFEYITMNGWG